jgi:hypothetical protein
LPPAAADSPPTAARLARCSLQAGGGGSRGGGGGGGGGGNRPRSSSATGHGGAAAEAAAGQAAAKRRQQPQQPHGTRRSAGASAPAALLPAAPYQAAPPPPAVPLPPDAWSVQQVQEWLQTCGCEAFCGSFGAHDMDGRALRGLAVLSQQQDARAVQETLRKEFGVGAAGPRMRLVAALQQLVAGCGCGVVAGCGGGELQVLGASVGDALEVAEAAELPRTGAAAAAELAAAVGQLVGQGSGVGHAA